MKSLESWAFYACNSLTSVKLPNLEQAAISPFSGMRASSLSVFLDNMTDIESVTNILNCFYNGKGSGTV